MRRAFQEEGLEGGEADTVPLARDADPFVHARAHARGETAELPKVENEYLKEALAIANSIEERHVRKQVLCAAYRKILRMSDTKLALLFPGTTYQRNNWIRIGIEVLMKHASPALRTKINSYSRAKVQR